MTETDALTELLKQALKAKGLTYKDVATLLDMTEAGVKRSFSLKTFSLHRFEQLCSLAGTTLENLSSGIASHKEQNLHEYTLEQEKLFSETPQYLAVFDQLLNGKTVKKIEKKLKLSKGQVSSSLKEIEKVGLIEWLPKDRIRILVSDVKWRENGPLRRKFSKLAKDEFLQHDFSGKNENFSFSILKLTPKSFAELNIRIKELLTEFSQKGEVQSKMGLEQKSVGLLSAVREWNFSVLLGKTSTRLFENNSKGSVL
jgi:transcriptional regulator with XRE-family HTH domain